jgi:hypothetical protein
VEAGDLISIDIPRHALKIVGFEGKQTNKEEVDRKLQERAALAECPPGPSNSERFIRRLIQMTIFRLSIIGPLPLCVAMMYDEPIS